MTNDKDMNFEEIQNFYECSDSDMPLAPGHKLKIRETGAFLMADYESRENAGLLDKDGIYYFDCPYCGSRCKGERKNSDNPSAEKGGSCCPICDIAIWLQV